MEDNKGKVKSLNKAIDILDALATVRGGLSLSEISARCGFPKSTAYALTSTMRDRGLIRQLPDGTYALGMRMFEYGSAVSKAFDIASIARPYLESLSSLTGADSVITMYNDYSAVSFDYSVSATGVQIIPEIGVKLPLHCTSQGKLLLAYLPDRKIISMLRDKQLIQYTPHTIVDTDRLLTEISEIRSMGYAVEDGEYKIGLRSVSAPVTDSSGDLRYALSTVGFFRKTSSEEFKDAVDATIKQADMLSNALIYD